MKTFLELYDELKEKGKIIIVLTNGASYPTSNKVSLFNKSQLQLLFGS